MTITEETKTEENTPPRFLEDLDTVQLIAYSEYPDALFVEVSREHISDSDWQRVNPYNDYRVVYGGRVGGGYQAADGRNLLSLSNSYCTTVARVTEFGDDWIRQQVGLMFYLHGWNWDRQPGVADAIMDNYVIPITHGASVGTFREAIRRKWNGFAYGEYREHWQRIEDRIRAEISGGWELTSGTEEDFQRELESVARSVWSRTESRRSGIAAFQAMRAEGFAPIHLDHVIWNLGDRMNSNGNSRRSLKGQSAMRSFVRKFFPVAATLPVPEDVAAITDVAQLHQLIARERAELEYAQSVLHRHADDRGWCSEYDEIARQAGWPRRPMNRTITFRATLPGAPLDQRWIDRNWGAQYRLAEGAVLTRSETNDFNLSYRSVDAPSKEEAMEKLAEEARAYVVRLRGESWANATLEVQQVHG